MRTTTHADCVYVELLSRRSDVLQLSEPSSLQRHKWVAAWSQRKCVTGWRGATAEHIAEQMHLAPPQVAFGHSSTLYFVASTELHCDWADPILA